MKKIFIVALMAVQLTACNKTQKQTQPAQVKIDVPEFSADSAYLFIEQQLAFGARVPNSEAQLKCANFLSAQLKAYKAEVIEQNTTVTGYDGKSLRCINIIGSFNPKATDRVLLLSHWDSRPWADHDPIPANRNKPVMAANDGASGVAVLIEMARQMSQKAPQIGVDLLFVDVEDYGAPEDFKGPNTENSWCLGTQYWATHPHEAGYRARYGILLDMVGAPGATFMREQISEQFASGVVDKIWSQAEALGFGQFFVSKQGGAVTDDHVYVNQMAGVPCIDIIQYDPTSGTGFAPYWHTTNDTMKNIDKKTLKAVGTTLMHVVYNEK